MKVFKLKQQMAESQNCVHIFVQDFLLKIAEIGIFWQSPQNGNP